MSEFGKIAYFAFISSINLSLVLVVYLRNRQALVNRLFAVSVLWVIFWTVSNHFLSVFGSRPEGLFWGKMTFAMASLIPPSFLAFSRAFPSYQQLRRDLLVAAFAAIGTFFFVASFTEFIVTAVTKDDRGLRLTYGPLYTLFALYFLAGFATSFTVLWKKYRVLRGIQRLRLRYLFLGTFLAVAGGSVPNLIIPLLFGTSQFSIFGPAFTVFAVAFVAHAILRHRLMDIRVVIRKGVSYAASLVFSGLTLFAGLALAYALVGRSLSTQAFIPTLVVGMAVALAFRPLLRLSQTVIDRYAQGTSYDHNRILQQATRTLSSLLDRGALLAYIGDVANLIVRPESITIYLTDGVAFQRTFFHTATTTVNAAVPATLPPPDPILALLKNSRAPLLKDEVGATSPPLPYLGPELTTRQWDLVIPIWDERSLIGLVALGPKLSGDPYFTPEIQLLTTIASQAGIVLANAVLYEEVKTVKEHIESILKHMESGVVATDRVGHITTINSAAEAILEIQASSCIGKSLDALPPPLASPLRVALQDGNITFQSELDITSENRPTRTLIISTSLIRDLKGQTRGAILLFTDHTRIRELEGEKRRAERLAAFQTLTSSIAHEIKNPLVAIRTFAELLPERFGDEEFHGEFSKLVIHEIERIDDLVARLRGLEVSSPQRLLPLDLREPIEDTLTLLRRQMEQSGITVKTAYAQDLPLIHGDRAQLKQLFLNLFMNALEAMQTGGELSVHVASNRRGNGGMLLVAIADTGTGIPDDLIDRIFDPFVTTKARGSGLGLSISRSIVDSHQATIRAHNNPRQRGTTILLEFPAAPVDRVVTALQ